MALFLDIRKRIDISSRKRKLDQFYSKFKEGMNVLDVGFANETKIRNPPAKINYFLKTYRYDPKTYTGISIEDTDGMDELYPEFRFVSYNGRTFPFKNDEFDWAFSNAVIEHVGNHKRQKEFLDEMLRVAKNVFFTTPNKYFPIESHTNIVFLHWSNYVFYKYIAKKYGICWPTKERPTLFSKRRLQVLLKESCASEYTILCNRNALMTMTFSVICKC
jgi:hypothetical protein